MGPVVHRGSCRRLLDAAAVSRWGAPIQNGGLWREAFWIDGAGHLSLPAGALRALGVVCAGPMLGMLIVLNLGILVELGTAVLIGADPSLAEIRGGLSGAAFGLASMMVVGFLVRLFAQARRARRSEARARALDEVVQVLSRLAVFDDPEVTLQLHRDGSWTLDVASRDACGLATLDVRELDGARSAVMSTWGVRSSRRRQWRASKGGGWRDDEGGQTMDLPAALGDWVGQTLGARGLDTGVVSGALRLVQSRARGGDFVEQPFRARQRNRGGGAAFVGVRKGAALWRFQSGTWAFWSVIGAVSVLWGWWAVAEIGGALGALGIKSHFTHWLMAALPFCMGGGTLSMALWSAPSSVLMGARGARAVRRSVEVTFDGRVLRAGRHRVDLEKPFAVSLYRMVGREDTLGVEVVPRGAGVGAAPVRFRVPVQPSEAFETLPALSFEAPEVTDRAAERLLAALAPRADAHGTPLRWSLAEEAVPAVHQEVS